MESINDITNIYYYDSPVGRFSIKYLSGSRQWILSVSNHICGMYEDPAAAAVDVYRQLTGYHEWDSYNIRYVTSEAPTDIHQWGQSKVE